MFPRPYPSPENLFALKFTGDSMVDAGISNNDWLVVNHKSTAEVGKVVVARLNGTVYVHRYMRDRNGEYLRPENTSHPIIRSDSEDSSIEIVGEVLAVQRILE